MGSLPTNPSKRGFQRPTSPKRIEQPAVGFASQLLLDAGARVHGQADENVPANGEWFCVDSCRAAIDRDFERGDAAFDLILRRHKRATAHFLCARALRDDRRHERIPQDHQYAASAALG